ncbi:Acyl-CoA synthetase family member 2, mitochondrial [Aquarana catesbeiana]|uniref:Medium-chain acyl-CoA ligase ACSF2, mitochondrial n=1 Tax=Aquarana catesbeiana TaxID=8400 RepID=A0A2G9RFJ5_AQUCT|nr:Acyl-CoA synthetase family member 2, mitochondrial [Aquarana catesbeiana]
MQQCLWDTTQRVPDQEAVVDVHGAKRKTYSQLCKDVETLAAGLLALGLKKGDRLGMWGPNSYEWIVTQFATAQAGIILVSVNPAYQAKELEYVLKKVGCSALVFPDRFKTQRYYEILRSICPEIETSPAGGIKSKALPDFRIAIVLDKKHPGAFHFEEVMSAGTTQHLKQLHDIQKSVSCEDPINVQFTSDCRIAIPVPLYHCIGSVLGSLTAVMYGPTMVLTSPSFQSRAVLEAVSKEKCSIISGTPTMYIDMLAEPDFATLSSTLTTGIIAGSIVPPEIMKKLLNETTLRNMVVGYGTTENSPVTFMGFLYDDIFRKVDTVGYVMSHTEAKVVDTKTEQILPVNASGELWIRGFGVMLGYWDEEERTKECITPEGWYKTGDIATLDEYGYCRIVGRCKDMIIRGGENIYPAEIEQFLHTHPKVMEAQIIGVKDARMGEEICACIRTHSDQECTAEELKAYCKGQISHFKIPRYIIFVNEYPLTISGKVQKFKLKEIMEKQLKL